MTDLEIAVLVLLAWVNGVFLGYIIWAPPSPFKQGFMDGLSLKFLWSKK